MERRWREEREQKGREGRGREGTRKSASETDTERERDRVPKHVCPNDSQDHITFVQCLVVDIELFIGKRRSWCDSHHGLDTAKTLNQKLLEMKG